MVVEPFCPARIPKYVSAEPIKIPNTKVKIAPYCSDDICTVESNNSPFTAPHPTNSIAENNESATTVIATSCLLNIDIIKWQRNDYIKVLFKIYVDFFVYDNVYTFNKRNPFSGSINSRLEVKSIDIPENRSFWFYTDMEYMQDNVNLQKRYVHIHPGVGTTNTTRFTKEPNHVSRTNFYYNPKDKRVEVRNSILPWSKPIFAKKCIYYGSELPAKKMSLMGEWYYDFGDNTIHLIIDYNIQKIKFHWEEGFDEPSTAEQLSKIAELELQIDKKEKELAQSK